MKKLNFYYDIYINEINSNDTPLSSDKKKLLETRVSVL